MARTEKLTTIGISKDAQALIDQYLTTHKGMTKKEFVEEAIKYFSRTGYDIRGDISDISPLEKEIMEMREINQQNAQMADFQKAFMQALIQAPEKRQLYLPTEERIQTAIEDKENYKRKYDLAQAELNRVKKELAKFKKNISNYFKILEINTDF